MQCPTCRFVIVATATLMLAVASAEAAQRTFVSSGGSDANPCTLVLPCRAFDKALATTDAGGEIIVLDSGGYGGVTINKSVSILAPAGVYAGVTVFQGTDGIVVAPGAGNVVLRGLTLSGQGGNNGIRVQAGDVHIENVVTSGMAGAGIRVDGADSVRISGIVSRSNADGVRIVPGASAITVLVRDSEFSGNANAGVGISPATSGGNAHVTIERSSATHNGAGFVVEATGASASSLIVTQSVASENIHEGVTASGAGASAYVRETAVTRNNVGMLQALSATLNACGSNLVVANVAQQAGVISAASCLDVEPLTCAPNAVANTLGPVDAVSPAPNQWFLAFSHPVTKQFTRSALFYTNQITYQNTQDGAWGALFQMRVKRNVDGVYVMPTMYTGGVALGGSSVQNAVMSDTVFDTTVSGDPPPGDYTFELWALTGGGTLDVKAYATNIAVLELPRGGCPHP